MRTIVRMSAVVALAAVSAAFVPRDPAPVADAAMRGDLAAVQTLIRAGHDVDAAQWSAVMPSP